jgi:putative ABC transport system ATP-binding protein
MIELTDIGKTYHMGMQEVQALRGINLSIQKGEYVAIMGPSGSGKSTLMNIIGCLDTPDDGAYILNGIDVSDMEDDDLARIRNKQIGFVFQQFNLLPRTSALKQVALPLTYAGYGRRERYDRAESVLKTVGLADRLDHRPDELSGGQQQRVAIARALVTQPSIILADEPTGNLDSAHGTEVMKLLTQLNESGTTIAMVTHSAHDADYAHRVIHLFDGHIVTVNIKARSHV